MADGFWDKALPAISALAAMIATSIVEARRTNATRKHELKIVFRQKLESLTVAVTESVAWTDSLLRATDFQDLRTRNVPIAPRTVLSLTLVYFPEIRPAAEKFLTASLDYSNFLVSLPRGFYPGTLGTWACNLYPDGYNKVTRDFQSAREDMDLAIAQFASSELRR